MWKALSGTLKQSQISPLRENQPSELKLVLHLQLARLRLFT